MLAVDREIGPRGYDPYCHNPYAPEPVEYWAIDVPGRAGPLLMPVHPSRVQVTVTATPDGWTVYNRDTDKHPWEIA